MKMVLKVIFLTMWLTILLFAHLMLFVDGGEGFDVGLLFIVIWWIITLPFIIFKWKKNHINTPKYKKQNGTTTIKYKNIDVEHSYFGKLSFKKDYNGSILELVGDNDKLYKFGDKKINDLMSMEISEEKINDILNSLEKIYIYATNILEECYKQISKLLPDEQGNPISVEIIKDKLELGGNIINDEAIEMTGLVRVYEGALFTIKIDIKTGEVECHIA